MQRVSYVFGAGLLAASLMAGSACAEPMNDGPQGQGTPSAGASHIGSTPAPAQPAGADRGDAGIRGNQAKDASDTKKGDEAADSDSKGIDSKHKSKKAEQEDRGDGKKADRHQGDKKAARDEGDEPRQAADRNGDDKAVARDVGSQKGDRARVSLDSSQRTKIQTYFRDHRPSGHRVERSAVSVSLGFAVPSTIVLAPLPPDVIVVSAACPVDYFVWANDLVLVDSCSREVVDIIPGGA